MWFAERNIEAQSDEHTFDVCLSVYMCAIRADHVPLNKMTKWFSIYLLLSTYFDIAVDWVDNSVRLTCTDSFLSHIHELKSRISESRMRSESEAAYSDKSSSLSDLTLGVHRPYASIYGELKHHAPQTCHQICLLWGGRESFFRGRITFHSQYYKRIGNRSLWLLSRWYGQR